MCDLLRRFSEMESLLASNAQEMHQELLLITEKKADQRQILDTLAKKVYRT